MKRYFTLFFVFALVTALLVGCGGKGNVSENEDGMIESSTTESSAPITVPTTQHTTASTAPTESTGLMEDILPDSSAQDSTSGNESSSTPENSSQNNNGRSRRSMPRF